MLFLQRIEITFSLSCSPVVVGRIKKKLYLIKRDAVRETSAVEDIELECL